MKQYKLYTTVGIIEANNYFGMGRYVLHREDGPAIISYNNDGSIWYEGWWWCGMRHRHDYTKPAIIQNDGKQYYYWYGRECTQKQLLNKKFRDRIQLEKLG